MLGAVSVPGTRIFLAKSRVALPDCRGGWRGSRQGSGRLGPRGRSAVSRSLNVVVVALSSGLGRPGASPPGLCRPAGRNARRVSGSGSARRVTLGGDGSALASALGRPGVTGLRGRSPGRPQCSERFRFSASRARARQARRVVERWEADGRSHHSLPGRATGPQNRRGRRRPGDREHVH